MGLLCCQMIVGCLRNSHAFQKYRPNLRLTHYIMDFGVLRKCLAISVKDKLQMAHSALHRVGFKASVHYFEFYISYSEALWIQACLLQHCWGQSFSPTSCPCPLFHTHRHKNVFLLCLLASFSFRFLF